MADRRRGRRLGCAVATVAALLALAGCGSSDAQGPIANFSSSDDDGMHGAVLPDPYQAPDTPLTATDGSPSSLADEAADNRLTLVFFGYTNCPDVCQIVMATIASAMTRLDPSVRDRVGMVFVTTDPTRDDPATLRAYLDRLDPRFEGLTGPIGTIIDVGKALGVPVEKGTKLPSGGYEPVHGAQIVGVRPDGSAPIVWTQSKTASQIADDITALVTTKDPT